MGCIGDGGRVESKLGSTGGLVWSRIIIDLQPNRLFVSLFFLGRSYRTYYLRGPYKRLISSRRTVAGISQHFFVATTFFMLTITREMCEKNFGKIERTKADERYLFIYFIALPFVTIWKLFYSRIIGSTLTTIATKRIKKQHSIHCKRYITIHKETLL